MRLSKPVKLETRDLKTDTNLYEIYTNLLPIQV